ncbi:hypothetical protein ACP3VZ_19455 [Vibrio sp. PNB22_2_2]
MEWLVSMKGLFQQKSHIWRTKESGVGREGAKQEIGEDLETKYVCLGGLS